MSRRSGSYDELGSMSQMHHDGEVLLASAPWQAAARAATQQAPSIAYEDFPREIRKPQIRVELAAKLLADSLHLHLD